MTNTLKISEHESVDWIFNKIPQFIKNMFIKNTKLVVTSFDANTDVVVLGTNVGYIYIMDRKTDEVQSFLLKKDVVICHIKIIQALELSVASGMENGLLFILKVPIKDRITLKDMNQFIVPVEHCAAITFITWSKNAEKLFSGDCMGNICCTEIDSVKKTVSSYHLICTSGKIFQMSYDHKCLVVSTEHENFIYNFSTNYQTSIGSKLRNQSGEFGACFLHKLCRSEDIEIVVIRPDSRIWISDLSGVIKRTILLKSETVFSFEKSISLLPCVTSQSMTEYICNIRSGAIKHQLGLITSISEKRVLFWSKNGIVFFDISTGKIISSACNLGDILSVSICSVNSTMELNSLFASNSDCRNLDNELLEIWILRKPLNKEDSTVVRISNIPLRISKLTLDPTYYNSQFRDSKYFVKLPDDVQETDSNMLININQSSNNVNFPSITGNKSESRLTKFELNVSEKFEEICTNVLELTKKTKHVLKNEILEKTDEGVEEALELTEEGLIIKFEQESYDESANSSKRDAISCSELNIKTNNVIINDNVMINPRKNIRILNSIDFDYNSLEEDASFSNIIMTKGHIVEDVTGINERQILNMENDLVIDENKASVSVLDRVFPSLKSDDTCNADISNNCELNYFDQDGDLPYVIEPVLQNESFENSVENVEDDCLPAKIDSVFLNDYSQQNIIIDESLISIPSISMENKFSELNLLFENSESRFLTKKDILTNEILSSCNKWISHRGPTFTGNNKIASLSINRRMIWLVDTNCNLHVGFKNTGEILDNNRIEASNDSRIQWFKDKILLTERIYSSPEGVIVWRDKAGEISIYSGMTRIWTPKVVKEKVLLEANWEKNMFGIRDLDIDNDMAVIVTKKGELKVMDGISGRIGYNQTSTASITGHVTLATIYNCIIWCVTEIIEPQTKIASQHIFSCLAKDEDEKLNISYWKTVPTPKDLVMKNEERLGILGGSSAIKNIHLGLHGFAWIITVNNLCFFTNGISTDNISGNGIWYQISLFFLSQTCNEENVVFGIGKFSQGIHNRVERLFGYPESEPRSKKAISNNTLNYVVLSAKAVPKFSLGNGLIWVTSTERNSPCILFESDKDILGHYWVDCLSNDIMKKTIASLPAILKWSYVTFGFKNVIWLVNNFNEIFCHWKENHIRNIAVPSSFGKVVQIAANGTSVVVLTKMSLIFVRINVAFDNPIGTDWRELSNTWSFNKEIIKHVSCFEKEIWLLTNDHVYYNEDILSLSSNNSKKCPWKSIDYKLNDSLTNTLSMIQVVFQSMDETYIWSVSDPDGYVYFGVLNKIIKSLKWIYIPGPMAKSVHVSDENLWMIELLSGEIYVRCGIDLPYKPIGDYWIHIPMHSSPVFCLSTSSDNNVVVIDVKNRILSHQWSVIKINENNTTLKQHISLNEFCHRKSGDGDWELLD